MDIGGRHDKLHFPGMHAKHAASQEHRVFDQTSGRRHNQVHHRIAQARHYFAFELQWGAARLNSLAVVIAAQAVQIAVRFNRTHT